MSQEIRRIVPALMPDSRYAVRVRALNEFGIYSPWSEAAEFETFEVDGSGTELPVPPPPTVIPMVNALAIVMNYTDVPVSQYGLMHSTDDVNFNSQPYSGPSSIFIHQIDEDDTGIHYYKFYVIDTQGNSSAQSQSAAGVPLSSLTGSFRDPRLGDALDTLIQPHQVVFPGDDEYFWWSGNFGTLWVTPEDDEDSTGWVSVAAEGAGDPHLPFATTTNRSRLGPSGPEALLEAISYGEEPHAPYIEAHISTFALGDTASGGLSMFASTDDTPLGYGDGEPYAALEVYADGNGYASYLELSQSYTDDIPKFNASGALFMRQLDDSPEEYELRWIFPDDTVVTLASNIGLVNDAFYEHVQGSGSATWTVVHNLGKYPSIITVDGTGTQIFGTVVYNSDDQITVTFAGGTPSGKAYCN